MYPPCPSLLTLHTHLYCYHSCLSHPLCNILYQDLEEQFSLVCLSNILNFLLCILTYGSSFLRHFVLSDLLHPNTAHGPHSNSSDQRIEILTILQECQAQTWHSPSLEPASSPPGYLFTCSWSCPHPPTCPATGWFTCNVSAVDGGPWGGEDVESSLGALKVKYAGLVLQHAKDRVARTETSKQSESRQLS